MTSWRVIQGDALEQLRLLSDRSVQTCVTSPPYFGLRDYGTATWEGGNAGCDHTQPVSYKSSTLGASTGGRSEETHARSIGAQASPYRDVCGKCGATRTDSQLGLEPTPDEYVARLVEVFREVRRVLRNDGTLWLNLGDSYAVRAQAHTKDPAGFQSTASLAAYLKDIPPGCKPKDLIGVPWMVAFALRADGWYLRSDIVWAKPNPMPESVTDRPTKAHEFVFLLSKGPRYFYDAEAIREDFADERMGNPGAYVRTSAAERKACNDRQDSGFINEGGGWERGGELGGRNKRSVWTVATAPFPGAHFAVFPPKLIEPCVLAGSAETDTVLDPFAGAGTTGLVATRHNRSFIGIELNPEYAEMARQRIRDDQPLMNYLSEDAA